VDVGAERWRSQDFSLRTHRILTTKIGGAVAASRQAKSEGTPKKYWTMKVHVLFSMLHVVATVAVSR
ncbi:MAG: hypothetical protein ACKVIN_09335, partial [Longimicrobiales bacterium]